MENGAQKSIEVRVALPVSCPFCFSRSETKSVDDRDDSQSIKFFCLARVQETSVKRTPLVETRVLGYFRDVFRERTTLETTGEKKSRGKG